MDYFTLTTGLIALSAVGSLVRVLTGPTIWDRLLGISLTASKVTLAVVLAAFVVGESYILDLALLFSLLGFLITVLLARFVERRGIV